MIETIIIIAGIVGYGAVAGIVYRAIDSNFDNKDWPKKFGSPEGSDWTGFAAAFWPLLGLPVYTVTKAKLARFKNARLDKEAEALLRKESK